MAEPCSYSDRGTPATPTAEQLAVGLSLSARFASKTKLASAESDAVSIMENIERLIFNQPQLDALGLELDHGGLVARSEEHTSELQSLMRISYAVFCLKK